MSYYFVYDEFLQDPKFEREIATIETRLTDLGISGKIARLALFRDAGEFIRDEVRRGVKNVVAVGNDLTLRRVIDALGDANVAIGIIPLGQGPHEIAKLLGVPTGVASCDVLSARILEEVDIGVVNGKRFIHAVKAESVRPFSLTSDQFKLATVYTGSFELRNLTYPDPILPPSDPTDGRIELVVELRRRRLFRMKSEGTTFLPMKSATMTFAQEESFFIDGEPYKTAMLHLTVEPGRLKFITSKDRMF